MVVKAPLPGVKPEDVNITIEGNTFTIEGEAKAKKEPEKKAQASAAPKEGPGLRGPGPFAPFPGLPYQIFQKGFLALPLELASGSLSAATLGMGTPLSTEGMIS